MCCKYRLLEHVCQDYGLDLDELSSKYNELSSKYNIKPPKHHKALKKQQKPRKKKQEKEDFVQMEEIEVFGCSYLVDDENRVYEQDPESGIVMLIGKLSADRRAIVRIQGVRT